ncbi:hypothetical protein [Aneurinibacillus tyrosinisolvens]|uniref:hypothetical protein n=1 Tax=Aneurinibacillus tyrosinisolvens TaxID=1443435 RepID=UPI00063FA570|nr:hypothetical protein [Aneurinibacillus tyrosinisolvens]
MAAFFSFFIGFIISFFVLALFYKACAACEVGSLYFVLLAFSAYAIFCNLYFHIAVPQLLWAFFAAQGVYSLRFFIKKGKRGEPQKNRPRVPAKQPEEFELEYIAQ